MSPSEGEMWIQTYTGRKFDFCHLRASDVCIEDIAHALSLINRFTGHTRSAYSVAEHSVRVSRKCVSHPLSGLLHDAHEAYLGDVSTPLKAALGASFRDLDCAVRRVVSERFGIPLMMPREVEEADRRMLSTEARDLMPDGSVDNWSQRFGEPYEEAIDPMGAEDAERVFLARYRELSCSL